MDRIIWYRMERKIRVSIENIGFIGTGIMGAAMAGHLLAAGFKVSVYNRTKSKAEGLIAQGAKWCESPGACARGQDVVITIVGYPKDVEEVYLGENGILANAKEGAYLIDMTTSSPILAERIFEAAKEKGFHAVDAPVTGGDTGAKNATLSILIGGEESSYEALQPVFSVLGKNLFNLVEDIVGILLGVFFESLWQVCRHSDSLLTSVSHLVQVNEYAWITTVKTNVLWEEHWCVAMGVEGDNL